MREDTDSTKAHRDSLCTEKMNRRSVLRAAGASVATATGLTVANPIGATDQYSNTINIVEDFGADNTGKESINEELDAAIDDDTKVIFPEGTYWIDDSYENHELNNVALVGHGDATLVPTDGNTEGFLWLWGDRVRFENFTIDYTAANTKVTMRMWCSDGLVMRNVQFKGVSDIDDGQNFRFIPAVTNPDGSGLVENVHWDDGTVDNLLQGGVWVSVGHAGDLTFRNCSWERWANNALYGSGPGASWGSNGAVKVERCYFRNNNVSSIRLGTPGSYVEDCIIVIDESKNGPPQLYPDRGGVIIARAVWLWYEFDGSVRNCDIKIDHPNGHGIVDHQLTAGGRIENTRVRLAEDSPAGDQFLRAVWFSSPGEPWSVEGLNVTGDTPNATACKIEDRDVTFRGCCINQKGDDRGGIVFENSRSEIIDTTIDVTGEPIVTDDLSDVSTENVSYSGSCSTPSMGRSWGKSYRPE